MGIVVAIIAQGTMGAGVGKRLHESGAEVRTLLSGRSAESAERARAAGMKPAADERALLEGADFFLDRKSTRLNSSHIQKSRMPSSA